MTAPALDPGVALGPVRITGGRGYRVDTDELMRAAHALSCGLDGLDALRLHLLRLQVGAEIDHAAARAAADTLGAAAEAVVGAVDPAAAARAAQRRERSGALLARLRDESERLATTVAALRRGMDEACADLGLVAADYAGADDAASALFVGRRASNYLRGILALVPPRYGPTWRGDPREGALDLGGFGLLLLGDGDLATGSERATALAPVVGVPLLAMLQAPGAGRRRRFTYNGERVDLATLEPVQRTAALAAGSWLGRWDGLLDGRTDRVDVWRAGQAPPAAAGMDRDGGPVYVAGMLAGEAIDGLTDLVPRLGADLAGGAAAGWGSAAGAALGGVLLPGVGAAAGGLAGMYLFRRVGTWAGGEVGREFDVAVDAKVREIAVRDARSPEVAGWAREFNRGVAGMPSSDGIGVVPLFEPTPIPGSVPEIIADVGSLKPAVGIEDAGAIRVVTTVFPDGTRAHLVEIPGTSEFVANNGRQAHDLLSDLELIGGLPSAMEVEVQRALDLAGVADGETLVLAGHSGGAAVAATLAADKGFATRYDVSHVLAAGGPVGHVSIPEETRVLALEHTGDGVPGLDGRPMAPSENHVTIEVDAPQPGPGRLDVHLTPAYSATATALDDAGVEEWTRYSTEVSDVLGMDRTDVTRTAQDFVGMRR